MTDTSPEAVATIVRRLRNIAWAGDGPGCWAKELRLEWLAADEIDRLSAALHAERTAREAAERHLTEARRAVAKLRDLVQCLIDNDPDDDAADAVCVLEVWRHDAKNFLSALDRGPDGDTPKGDER